MKSKIKALESQLQSLGEVKTTDRADVLNELAWEIGYSDLERFRDLSCEAKELSEKLSYEHGKACSNRNLGFYGYAVADYDAALRKSFDALTTFAALGDKTEEGNTLNVIGLTYWSIGNFDLAVEFLHRAVRLFRETGNQERLPWAYYGLGGVYQSLGDFKKSLEYQQKALDLFRAGRHRVGEGRALSGIGTVYQSENRFEKALEYHFESLKLYQESRNELGEARAFNDIGEAYRGLGNMEEAFRHHHRSLEIRQRLGNRSAEITSLVNLGKLHNQQGEASQALVYLRKALILAQKIEAKPKLYPVHQVLAETYERCGELEQSLKHLKAYQQIKEEVFSDEMKTRLKNQEIQFGVEKAEKEAEIHRLRNIELRQALDDLKEAQVQLVQSEKMAALGRLTAGIAHEINNPIGAIKSSADISIRGLEKIKSVLNGSRTVDDILRNDSYQRSLRILEENSRNTMAAVERIGNIVSSLKNFARLDEAEYQRADIHDGIRSTLTLLQHEVGKGVSIRTEFGDVPPLYHAPSQLNQVFMTLLRNALQAIERDGEIIIRTAVTNGEVQVEISDSGKGMTAEIRDSLFDLNFTTKSSRVGIGMGLYNAHTIMQRHKGRIRVESVPGKGSTFTLALPIA